MKKVLSLLLSVIVVINILFCASISTFAATTENIVLNQVRSICLDDTNEQHYYKFIPTKTGYYEIDVSSDNEYAVFDVSTMDVEYKIIRSAAWYDDVEQYKMIVELKANAVYYICVDNYGLYDVTVSIQIRNHSHNLKAEITPAKIYQDYFTSGDYSYECNECNYYKYGTIDKIESIELSKTSYKYDGKAKTPSVVVKDASGRKLKNKEDYTVTYQSGRKNIGKYSVTVQFKGENYSGKRKLYFKINEAKHTEKTTVTKATTKSNGKIVKTCSTCNKTLSKKTIQKIGKITLSKNTYIYDGKAKKPAVSVKDNKGIKISSSNFDVKYSSNKNVGIATVTIKFKGNYKGTVKKTFKINPKSTSVSKITAKEKEITVKWKKNSSQISGYQIQYSTNSNFKNSKTITVAKKNGSSKTIKGLKSSKKYYVRVRTYKSSDNEKLYSAWSESKSITTKSVPVKTSTSTNNNYNSYDDYDGNYSSTVYITPTGKKYHRSSACAGKNAMARNISDVEGFYGPCKKCA